MIKIREKEGFYSNIQVNRRASRWIYRFIAWIGCNSIGFSWPSEAWRLCSYEWMGSWCEFIYTHKKCTFLLLISSLIGVNFTWILSFQQLKTLGVETSLWELGQQTLPSGEQLPLPPAVFGVYGEKNGENRRESTQKRRNSPEIEIFQLRSFFSGKKQ